MRKNIPITLITGYLGSGKTSLLNHVLANQEGIRAAVIVNDIGEINIDESLIENGARSELGRDIVPLTNGCICCSLKSDLIKQVIRLSRSEKFDCILIEASGICEPLPIAQTLSYGDRELPSLCHISSVISVVDAMRLADEYLDGEYLLGELEEDDVARLIIEQIEFCSAVVINKASSVSPDDLPRIRAVIRHLQPSAALYETDYGRISPSLAAGTDDFGFSRTVKSAGWIHALETPHEAHCSCAHEHSHSHDDYGIGTFVYERVCALDRSRLSYLIENAWPDNLIRCKGFICFSDAPESCFLLEQAGRQVVISYFGQRNTGDKGNTAFLHDDQHHALRGQYATRLVFIGKNMDPDVISASLDTCLIGPT